MIRVVSLTTMFFRALSYAFVLLPGALVLAMETGLHGFSFLLAIAVLAALVTREMRCSIALTSDRIVVKNPFRDYSIPLSEVRAIGAGIQFLLIWAPMVPSLPFCVVIETHAGRKIRVASTAGLGKAETMRLVGALYLLRMSAGAEAVRGYDRWERHYLADDVRRSADAVVAGLSRPTGV